MNIGHCWNRWIPIFLQLNHEVIYKMVDWNFPMTAVLIDYVHLNTFVSRRLVTSVLHSPLLVFNVLIFGKVFQNLLIIYPNLFCLNSLSNTLLVHVLINRVKSTIRCWLSNRFQRASFDHLKFVLPTNDNVTQVVLYMCEIQDKGKGHYTEIRPFCQNIWLSKFRKV